MTINCNVVKDLLPSYVDGLTSEESNRFIVEHLDQCASCQKDYKSIQMSLEVSPPIENAPSIELENKLMKNIKIKLITVVLTVMTTFLMLGIVIGAFGDVLFQEGNPLTVGAAIIKLQFSEEEYAEVGNGARKYIAKFEGNNASVLKQVMKNEGWTFVEQIGSGYVFQKGEQTLTVSTRMLTKYFYVWLLPERETTLNE